MTKNAIESLFGPAIDPMEILARDEGRRISADRPRPTAPPKRHKLGDDSEPVIAPSPAPAPQNPPTQERRARIGIMPGREHGGTLPPNFFYAGITASHILKHANPREVFGHIAPRGGIPVMIQVKHEGGEKKSFPLGSLWLAEQVPETLKQRCLPQPRYLRHQLMAATARPASMPDYQDEFYGRDNAGYALDMARQRGQSIHKVNRAAYLMRLPYDYLDRGRQSYGPAHQLLTGHIEFPTPKKLVDIYGQARDGGILIAFRHSADMCMAVGILHHADDIPEEAQVEIRRTPLSMKLTVSHIRTAYRECGHVGGESLFDKIYGPHTGLTIQRTGPNPADLVMLRPPV